MRLKSLEIHGFKSFADKTKLSFDRQITGIVGPNGCGKSNVVDAIRWVLGEQKIRNLRSEKMENVIFNGTDQRKRANLTEVTITFDNDRGVLPPEFGSVAITRRLYRDGESEYLLNGVNCRLKDIHNLLLDTGAGSDSYAIIELGMIEEMITDRQGSRRQLFEEAAGVARYKVRKRETLQRLNDTVQSLERVEDLVYEVERQAKRYEKQAQKAARYRKLKEDYRAAGVRLAWLQLRQAGASRAAFEAEENAIRDRRSALEAETARLEAQIADLAPRRLQYETQLANEQKALQERIEAIRGIEQEKTLRKQRADFLRQRLAEMDEAARNGQADRERCAQRMEELETAIDAENEQSDRVDFLIGEREAEVADLREAVRNRKLQVDELTQTTRAKEQQLNRLRKEVDVRLAKRNALEEEVSRVQSELERQNGVLEQSRQEQAHVRGRIETLEKQRREQADLRAELERKIAAGEQEKLRLSEERSELVRRRALTQQERDLIRNLIENLDGYPDSVAWLKRKVPAFQDTPLVSDVFYCDAPYRAALEHFLEGYVNSYVVRARSEALEAVRLLAEADKGRAHFFILEDLAKLPVPAKAPDWDGHRRLLDVVEYDAAYAPLAQALLANAWIAESDADISPDWPDGRVWLHPSGRFVARANACSGGSVGKFEGKRLGRKQHLERLAEEVKTLDEAILAVEQAAKANTELLAELRKQLPDQELNRTAQQIGEAQREESRIQARIQEIESNLERTQRRASEIKPQLAQFNTEINSLQPQADSLHDDLNDLNAQLVQQQKAWNERNEAYTRTNAELNKEQILLVQIQNRIESLKQDFRNQLARVQEIEERGQRYDAERTQVEQNLSEITAAETRDDEELLSRYRAKDEQEQRVNNVREQLLAGREQEQRLESQIKELRKQREVLIQGLETLRQEQTAIELELRSLTERLSAEWQIEIGSVKPEEWFEAIPEADSDLQPWKIALEQLKTKFYAFGEVNTMAEEAYQEAADRLKFLVEQRADLLEAKKNLMSTIEEIDLTAQKQFLDTFNIIRENFIRVFRTLFTEHDACDLILQNPEDPLESTIDIIARPKGKRPLTLQQLSGGEKTLTAISLLFSIYLYKPAPFCIFDEVDAPLDDANVDKFSAVIETFSKESQFVVITHNKRTMQRTQTLYGVTMEETGVSRILAVDWAVLNLN